MRWLSTKYAYPLVINVLIVSIILQFVWLNQLFRAQRVQVRNDLERIVNDASQKTMFASVARDQVQNNSSRDFFLSPEWQQLRIAYDNMQYAYNSGRFSSDDIGDSTIIAIRIAVQNKGVLQKRRFRRKVREYSLVPMSQIVRADSLDLIEMVRAVKAELSLEGINTATSYLVYTYEDDDPNNPGQRTPLKKADFYSNKYTYNLHFHHKYQLVVPAINGVIWYRIRYYLVSSLFMILLTGTVFYFILRLMRKQRMYAEARIAFTSNMTHELKTPVATVAVALESITKYGLINDPEKLQKYLQISQFELQRLNLMIEKVLNLEQLDNGQGGLRSELYDVQAGLQQVIASMHVQIEKKNATVEFHASADPCFINGDPMHLTNVFYNLVDNALKYGSDKLFLTINCICKADHIIISFQDNGPGIDSLYHEQIFERFFRVQGDNDVRTVNGSGLGLHYVKQVIEKHGGKIKVYSEPGKGSNFIINLPAAS